ncbi:methyltransferase domain-containing protein [Rhodospirillaceae bacterium SYSU D60014]|uniref:class I SAM-dependent methyltransferase n=1 Tax=Virgifigura deserti TaxID=2268457 RepID=UPI0013C509D4
MGAVETLARVVRNRHLIKRAAAAPTLKLNLGCGGNRQDGYVNVDVRPLPSVDLVAGPKDCLRYFSGRCDEIYISHVLEHFASPGKAKRDHDETVLGFLKAIHMLLKPGGVIRVAVPDFGAITRLYVEGRLPLYPRLLGRLCGEQDYRENLHKCLFDRAFLEQCLTETGFVNVQEWDPETTGLRRDSSFDELDGIRTSLNLMAEKG